MKRYIKIIFLNLLLNQSGITQPIQMDLTMIRAKKWNIGAGVFAGPHFLLGLPKGADYNMGSNIGLGGKVGYCIGKGFSISTEARFIYTNQVINLKNSLDPDLFVMKTSTIQLPFFIGYDIKNHKREHVMGLYLGFGYQWNNYNTVYVESALFPALSTVAVRQVSVDASERDMSILFGVHKQFYLNKAQTTSLTLFNEYQYNFGGSRFRYKIDNPIYLLFTDQDQFTPILIRLGCYLNLVL